MKKFLFVLPVVMLLAGCKLEGGSGSVSGSVTGDDSAPLTFYAESNPPVDFLTDPPPSDEPLNNVVPEPSTMIILSLGLFGLAASIVKRKLS